MSDPVTSTNTPPPDLVASAYTAEMFPRAEMVEIPGFGLVHSGEKSRFLRYYAACAVRGTWHKRSEMFTTYQGLLICSEEAVEVWFCDEDTRWYWPVAERAEVCDARGTTKFVSKDTRRQYYRKCSYLQKYFPSGDGRSVRNYGWVSNRGLELGDFGTCDECGHWFELSALDVDCYCAECTDDRSEEEPAAIREYSDTSYPAKLWLADEPSTVRLYGVENEVEVRSSGNRETCARNVIGAVGSDFAILKSDGSLDHGFEIVTAPASLKAHAERWARLCVTEPSDPRKNLRSAKTETCGLHVHASRCDLKSPLHLGRILVFMNEPAHKEFIEGIARREETDWCRIHKKKLGDGLNPRGDGNKYVAVNLNHTKTIEFRIFKGTLTYRHFMSSVEFVDALFDFTTPATVGLRELTPARFAEFVKNRRKQWPNLTNELVSLGYLPSNVRFGGKGKGVSVEPTRIDAEKVVTEQIAHVSEIPVPTSELQRLLVEYSNFVAGIPNGSPFSERCYNSPAPTADELLFMRLVLADGNERLKAGDWMPGYSNGPGEWADGIVGQRITPALRVMRFDPNTIAEVRAQLESSAASSTPTTQALAR